MSFLPELNQWDPGIYQLEETDPVQGGANGKSNQQAKELGNRTLYLKNLVEALGTGKLDLAALASQAEAEAGASNTKWMTPLRVAQAIATLAAIAEATETTSGKVELATVAETVTGTDTARATHPAGVKAAVAAAVAALVNASPTTLDTLNELAAALGNDSNFAASMATALSLKASINANNNWTKAQRGAIVALDYGATVTPDFSASNNSSLVLTGSATMANPSNLAVGQSGVIAIMQDGTGGRAMAFGSYYKFSRGTVPALTTTSNAVDHMTYYVETPTRILVSLIKDLK